MIQTVTAPTTANRGISTIPSPGSTQGSLGRVTTQRWQYRSCTCQAHSRKAPAPTSAPAEIDAARRLIIASTYLMST